MLEDQSYAAQADFDFNLADVIRFFRLHRARLLAFFCLFFLVGASGLLVWRSFGPWRVQGRLVLSFKGIEKGEYPDGRKFNVETLQSPDVISAALINARLAKDRLAAGRLSPEVEITPVIPRYVVNRWAKQDKDGVRRDDYFPSEFAVSVSLPGLPMQAGPSFFMAMMQRYQEREKTEQVAALQLAQNGSRSGYYSNLLQDPNYDYDDLLRVFDASVVPLNAYLDRMLGRDLDPSLQAGLKDVQNELALWSMTHLETLRAMTYGGGLVKNKETAAARLRYRRNECLLQIRQKTEEAAEALKLLAVVQKPQPLLVARSGQDAAVPADSVGLERLVSSNYVSPLVKRVSDLQQTLAALEAEKTRLEQHAAMLSQAHGVAPGRLPGAYLGAVSAASKELEKIVDHYNDVIGRYMTSTIAGSIAVKEGPILVRPGPSASLVLLLIIAASGLLAVAWVRLAELLRTALPPEKAGRR